MANNFCYNSDLTNLTRKLSETSSPTMSAINCSLGVVGNLFALALLVKHSSEHKWKVFYRLVAGLVVTDLFGILACSPIAFIVYINKFRWVGGQVTCDYLSFMMIFASTSTMLITSAMSFDRFLAIWYPFFYNYTEKKRRVHVILCSLWVFALIISSLPLFKFGHNIRHFPCTWCFFDYFGTTLSDVAYSLLYATLGLIVITTSSILNSLVIISVAKGRTGALRSSIKSCRSIKAKRKAKRNEIYIVTFIVAVLCAFAVCWVPLMVRVLTNTLRTNPVNFEADILAIRFASWNQILDPWIYIVLRKEMMVRIYSFYHKWRYGSLERDGTLSNSVAGDHNQRTDINMSEVCKNKNEGNDTYKNNDSDMNMSELCKLNSEGIANCKLKDSDLNTSELCKVNNENTGTCNDLDMKTPLLSKLNDDGTDNCQNSDMNSPEVSKLNNCGNNHGSDTCKDSDLNMSELCKLDNEGTETCDMKTPLIVKLNSDGTDTCQNSDMNSPSLSKLDHDRNKDECDTGNDSDMKTPLLCKLNNDGTATYQNSPSLPKLDNDENNDGNDTFNDSNIETPELCKPNKSGTNTRQDSDMDS